MNRILAVAILLGMTGCSYTQPYVLSIFHVSTAKTDTNWWKLHKKFLKGSVYRAVHMGGSFTWMLIDQKYKKSCGFIKDVSPSFKPNKEPKRFSRGTSREVTMKKRSITVSADTS